MTVGPGDVIYVADRGSHKIRRVTSAGDVSTISLTEADGGSSASFEQPTSLVIGSSGELYVTDWANHRVRLVTRGGQVSTIAGDGAIGSADGVGTAAEFREPFGIDIDAAGNLYVVELTGHRVRKLTVNAVSLPQSNLDSDGDGIADHSDTCPLIADATNADTDGDGLGDACEIPQQDLLAFYGFDNSTVDSSVFGRTATLQNGPGYTVDRHGQSNGSIYLENNAANAVNGSPVVGNAGKYITAPSVTLGPSITLGGWVKVESLNLWQRLFDFADGQAQNNLYLALNNSNRYFSLAGYNSASEVYRGDISAATIELDHWYHVVAVANAASDNCHTLSQWRCRWFDQLQHRYTHQVAVRSLVWSQSVGLRFKSLPRRNA